jgi:hypothetical protein
MTTLLSSLKVTVRPADGSNPLILCNGNKPLELQKGMLAIEVGEEEELVNTIDTIIAVVVAGDLDPLLTKGDKPKGKIEKNAKL